MVVNRQYVISRVLHGVAARFSPTSRLRQQSRSMIRKAVCFSVLLWLPVLATSIVMASNSTHTVVAVALSIRNRSAWHGTYRLCQSYGSSVDNNVYTNRVWLPFAGNRSPCTLCILALMPPQAEIALFYFCKFIIRVKSLLFAGGTVESVKSVRNSCSYVKTHRHAEYDIKSMIIRVWL